MDDARLQAVLGILVLPAIAWLLSEDRRAVDWRRAAIALLATILVTAAMIRVPGARAGPR
ncbi:MAG: Na+ dependent nucleoside transporter N-terminal domain-containing protein [Alphaproteobacteria bacterium]